MRSQKIVILVICIILILPVGYFIWCTLPDNGFLKEKTSYKTATEDEIIDPVQTMPSFPGGEKALNCFIYHHFDTTKLLKKAGIIAAQFTIDSNGKINDVRIVKSVDSEADAELVRIIKLMPLWNPSTQNNKKIRVKYTLPLRLPYENKYCR